MALSIEDIIVQWNGLRALTVSPAVKQKIGQDTICGVTIRVGEYLPDDAWIEHYDSVDIVHCNGYNLQLPKIRDYNYNSLQSKTLPHKYETRVYPQKQETMNATEGTPVPEKKAQRETNNSPYRLDVSLRGESIDEFEKELSKRIIGQPDAVAALVYAYQLYITGLNAPHRPIAVLLFAGPTGTGKSHAAAVASATLLNPDSLIEIDCEEFQHSHEISKLIGSPPGYLGHRETNPRLCQSTLDSVHTEKHKISFVLFDEIEKANDALWNLLLGITGKALLTLGDNRTTDFSKSVIIMTSNLGAQEMNKMLSGTHIGFAQEHANDSAITAISNKAIRGRFTPEFVNRIDRTVIFKQLTKENLHDMFALEMAAVQERILNAKVAPFLLSWTPETTEYIIQRGTDQRYGARELKRTIDRLIVAPLTNAIASQQIRTSDTVTIDVKNDELVFVDTPTPR